MGLDKIYVYYTADDLDELVFGKKPE